jgi:peptidoglycan/LPS O-acetylase OafA/YrhL
VEISGETWRLGHRPALDGLRGVAIVLVLCAHFDNPWVQSLSGLGKVGVTVFFTLSGFLITALLLEEYDRLGRVSLRAFYRRRARRLLPALIVVLLFVVAVQAAGRTLGVSRGMWFSVLLYSSNWWQLSHPSQNGLATMWSLAIEEQFYLVWPAVFLFAMARWGRRGVSIVAAAGVVVSVVAVFAPGGDPAFGSLERASSLLVGCILAAWMFGRRESRSRPMVAAAALAGVVPLAWTGAVVPIVLGVPLATAATLWAVSQGRGLRILEGRVIRWFGQRSYGIYLWHYPIEFTMPLAQGGSHWPARAVVEVLASLLMAELSWRFIEAPLLHRSRGSRQSRGWIVARSHQPEAAPSIG